MKRLLSILAATAAFIGVGHQASALTDWRTFGYTQDSGSFPWIELRGGTTNPEWVRVVLKDGTYAGATSVSVSLRCRDSNFNSFERSIRQSLALPRTFAWDIPTWVTHCSVSVSAMHFNTGALSANVAARY